MLAMAGAQHIRPLDEDVPQRGQTGRLRREHRHRQRARTGARFDDDERIGFTGGQPPVIERTCEHGAEEWSDFRRREEVAAPTRGAHRRVEAVLRVVEGGLHDLGEGNRPAPSDLRGDPLFECVHPNANVAMSPTRPTSCG